MFYVKRLVSALMIMLLLSSALLLIQPAPAQAVNYSDISRHWARDAIVRWEALGALVDFPDNAFRPDTPITRVEFFSILVHALGATEEADISQFTDVSEDAWYYSVVAKAAQMRIANGVSENTMKPLDNIIRQDAATLVARAMGLAGENANYLYRYNDRDSISNYASNFVSAVTEFGYMSGSYGNFNPRNFLSRAEAVKIVDNLFTHYYRSEVGFDSFTLNGNVMSSRADSVFNNLTINGDLILTDGVGQGNATLNNCTISGRLLIRGGGSNSIVLNNTRVGSGITVISPSSTPRVVSNGTSSVPQLNAYSSFILSGTGVRSAAIMDDAFYDSTATLEGVMLDTMYAGGVGNNVDLREGRITNLHVGGAADNASCTLANGALVDYFSTVAPYTSISGAGTITDAFINAPGANFAMTPFTYTVGANLSATVAGQTATGRVVSTQNAVGRNTASMAVSQDSDRTGGEDIRVDSTQGRSSNTVLVTQKPFSKVQLEDVSGRLGYYIGFFIPAPAGRGNSRIDMLNYVNSDGGLVTMEDVSLTRKGGVYGLEFHIPVTRIGPELRGQLNETMYIQWDSQNTENLQFHSGWLDLEPLTGSQENRLLEQYEDQRFYGYDGSRYSGEEALQRLLASDNALGLDVKGFAGYSTEDQEALAERLLELSSAFNSKETVQAMINQVITGKAAMYAVNNAVTAAQVRSAFENTAFAKELNIEVSSTSLYGLLSDAGKQRVASVILNGRSKDFADAAAVKTAFDKAVADIRSLENSLLVALNASRLAADSQKLVETKANADILNFFPAEEPYKSFPAAMKLELGQRLLSHKPYYSVDAVAQVIRDFMVTAEESGAGPASSITGIKAEPSSLSLLVGETAEFNILISLSDGVWSGFDDASITNSAPNIIDVDDENLVVTAKAAGSARITASITDKETKKTFTATIAVTVKNPVPSTSVTLTPKRVEVEVEATSNLLVAKMMPATTTDTLTWSVLHPNIAAIRGTGGDNCIVEGLAPGITTAIVRTSSNLTDSAEVFVISKDPGVMINPGEITVGIGQIYDKLEAIVSPLSIGEKNRGVRWTSMDPTVATVDPYGRVTGVDVGETEIIATSIYFPDQSASCYVTVDDSIKKITLNTRKAIMVPTGIEQLTATVIPSMEANDRIIWKVRPVDINAPVDTATEIATVKVDDTDSMKATITAVSPGKVYVYAYLESDSSAMAECEVEVLSSTLKITFPATLNLYAGDRLTTAIPTFAPATITNKTIKWSINSTPEDIANGTEIAVIERVNANGSLTILGKRAGSVTLTGEPESIDNTVISCKITVSNIDITSFNITPAMIEMEVGAEAILATSAGDFGRFDVQIKPDNASDKTIYWSASGTAVYLEITQGLDTSINEYGTSQIKAVMATHALDPDTGLYVGTPTTLYARAGNITRPIQVIVYPAQASQVTNIKIQADKWVYEVGDKLDPFTFHLNVTRRRPSGEWITGPKPPNVSVTWKSSKTDVAYFNDANQLIMVGPGTTDITATTANSNASDTISIIVAPPAIDKLNFSGLDADEGGYGKTLHMTVGDEQLVTAAISPPTNQAVKMNWVPYIWEYDDEDEATINTPGYMSGSRETTPAWTTLSIDVLRNNILQAVTPGRVQVVVTPESSYKYAANVSINSLRTNYSAADFNAILAANGIVGVLDTDTNITTYYSPNEHPLINSGKYPNTTGKPLDQAVGLQLLIPNRIAEGNNDFFVWITGKKLDSVSFGDTAGTTLAAGDRITLTAKINPAPYVMVDSANIEWSSNSNRLLLVANSETYNQATGECSATFRVTPAATPGTYEATVKVTSSVEYGFRSSQMKTRQKVGGDTASATYTITVPEPPAPISAPLQLAAPAMQSITQVAKPAIQPAPPVASPAAPPVASPAAPPAAPPVEPPAAPVANDQPAVNNVLQQPPASQPLPSVSTAKTLQVRKTATVLAGSTIALVPFATPAVYDYAAISWSSSKPEIATVSANGIVSGIKAGKANITATVAGTKLKAVCAVTVSAAPKVAVSSISLSNSTLTLEEDKSATLKATFNPTTASIKGISWLSSDVAIAKVDAAGKVTAVSAGSATITAITDDSGRTASCNVTVTPKPIRVTGVTLNQTTLNLLVGDTYTLEHTIAPSDAANQEVRWVSNNARIVSVDENGNITALRKGTAIISVISSDGNKRATCRVVVK